jgi:hypothetical protein
MPPFTCLEAAKVELFIAPLLIEALSKLSEF